jgi:hypothetical protein
MAKLLGGMYADKIVQYFSDTPSYEALNVLMTTSIWKEPALTTFTTGNIPRYLDGKPWPKVDRSHPRITVISNVLTNEALAVNSLIQIINPDI